MTPDFIKRARQRHTRGIWIIASFWLGVIFSAWIVGVMQ